MTTSTNTRQTTKGISRRTKKAKKWTWKKPTGKPKRPLSAYNLFFQEERKKFAPNQHTGQPRAHPLGFALLAKTIGQKWKSLNDAARSAYIQKASIEKQRYEQELNLWIEKQNEQDKGSQQNEGNSSGSDKIPIHSSSNYMLDARSALSQPQSAMSPILPAFVTSQLPVHSFPNQTKDPGEVRLEVPQNAFFPFAYQSTDSFESEFIADSHIIGYLDNLNKLILDNCAKSSTSSPSNFPAVNIQNSHCNVEVEVSIDKANDPYRDCCEESVGSTTVCSESNPLAEDLDDESLDFFISAFDTGAERR